MNNAWLQNLISSCSIIPISEILYVAMTILKAYLYMQDETRNFQPMFEL